MDKKGTWLTYRPDIKILDCTIRDGGLMNNCNFDDAFVRSVYEACVESGADYMEVGYKGAKKLYSPAEYGKWKYCDEEDVRRVVGENKTGLKLSVMADVERCDYHTDILPKDKSVIDLVRVATYIHQIPGALDMIKDARDKGYEVSVNLMAVSVVSDDDLNEALEILATSETNVIYLVDSYCSLYSEEVQALIRKYLKYAEPYGKKIGIHAHNNQQLAYANTIEALILGASFLDSTVGGLGRGAGNCPTELLMGFLKNPRYYLRPVIKCIQESIVPMRQKITWGYDIPYMLTGQMNQHPRDAMAFLDGETPTDYLSFYDQIVE
jgi:4-hydroxy 2-oxovalerate aldolase